MARGARRPAIATGIYPHRFGNDVRVSVKGKVYRTHFPLGTSLQTMQQWQADERAWRLRDATDTAHAEAPAERGTLASDIDRHLKARVGRPAYQSDRSHLLAWVPHLGKHVRSSIKPQDIKVIVASWRSAGKSARTIRHRVRLLRHLWHSLEGKRSRTPLDELELPRPATPNPTPVPTKTILDVAKQLKHGSPKTYARFLVRAVCGQRPAQIMWTQPEDVDLVRKIWFVRSAKGGRQIPMPLGAEGVKAWKAFIKAAAWGAFDTRNFSKDIKRHGWPQNVRPYNLRHTFAIDHLLAGTSLDDLQGLMGHRQITTTRLFYAPVLTARLKTQVGRRKLGL